MRWEWNHSSLGYDGVSIEGELLIWYHHEHNTLAGSAALAQSITDFRANGPPLPMPDELLAQLRAAVGRSVES